MHAHIDLEGHMTLYLICAYFTNHIKTIIIINNN